MTTRILFITATRLGDAILTTGALDHLARQFPDAEITIACGAAVAEIFTHAPRAVRVIPLHKKSFARHWIDLWRKTRNVRWDIIVDLRNGPVSRLLRARQKYIWGRPDPALHKVEQIAQLLHASPVPAPVLWFDEKVRIAAEKCVPAGVPVLALAPSANWPAKTWPTENFIELVRRLTAPAGPLPGARIAVFAAPGEEAPARKVLESVAPERRIDGIGTVTPLLAAAAIARCDLFIGNDSGLMHAAAAVGTPTLGLFGPSYPKLYRPWGPRCAYVSTPETFDELTGYAGYKPKTAPCLMTSLTINAAEQAAKNLWDKVKT